MRNSIRIVFSLLVLSLMIVGCSGGGNPLIPTLDEKESAGGMPPVGYGEVSVSERTIIDLPSEEIGMADGFFNGTGILGGFDMILYDDMSSEIVPIRHSALGESYVVSGASFFTVTPCIDCLKIKSIELTADGDIRVVFLVTHPFEKGNRELPPTGKNRLDLDIFDLALVIMPYSASFKPFPKTGKSVYYNLCKEMDGFTTELSELTNNINVCPYYLVVDDTDTGVSTYNEFEMGTKDKELEVFIGRTGRFGLFLTMGYGVSADLASRLSPFYFNPEFNRKAAWKVDVIPPQGEDAPVYGNTWSNDNSTAEYNVRVVIYDWQQNSIVASKYPDILNPDHILKTSRVESVSAEVLNMTNTLKIVREETGGTGAVDDPIIFDVPLRNENLLATGQYLGLVKVLDERLGGSGQIGVIDSLVHVYPNGVTSWFPIEQFATYQLFVATVVSGETIRVTSPNGGESWGVGTSQIVQWTSTGSTANVDISLSLNGGTSYTVPIGTMLPNTGSYNIPSVGNWETTTARIKVTNSLDGTITDTSDANFTISTVADPIQIITPNGAEIWPKGTIQNIRWNGDAGIAYVKITLSQDGGVTYNFPITGSTLNDGQFEWNIPETAVSATCRIKVQHLTNPLIFDVSDNDFEIYCPVLNPPSNFTASDDAYSDKVVVTWSTVGDATAFNLYRDGALVEPSWGSTLWEDTFVVPGVIYHYQIEAINSCGTGPAGPADPGEPGSACVIPNAPSWCTATDGTLPDRVNVTWEDIAEATAYDIYRDGDLTAIATGIPTNAWDDTSVVLCDVHTYEVVGTSGCGDSPRSPSDSGYSEYFTPAPANVNATDGDYHNRVTLTWAAVPTATTYNIYRNALLHQANVGNVTTWDDTSIVQGVVYLYHVSAENECGEGSLGPIGLGEPGNACIPLPAPAFCSASDGTYTNRVELTWPTVIGATGYNIYRDSNPTPYATNVPAPPWNDNVVIPCDSHDYQVSTLSTCGESTLCAIDSGNSSDLPPGPGNVDATDDAFPNKVVITWDAVTYAFDYNIYRNSVLYQANVGNVLTWEDTTVVPGTLYNYQVQAINLCGSGALSAIDSGNACVLPTDPTNVTASDDLFPDKIVVSWDPVGGAQYNIYRDSVLQVGGYALTSWDDTSIVPGTTYFYQVEAFNGCGYSAIMPPDPGDAGSACLVPGNPSALVATDGDYPNRVALTWTAGTGATSYNIYRDTLLINTSPTNAFDDFTATPGVLYSYQVETQNACGPSLGKSNSDDGWSVTCLADSNDTCGTAELTNLFGDPQSGCASQIDPDWFHLWVPPKGILGTSTIDFSGMSGGLDVEVYSFDPGGGPCPGTLLTSGTNLGNGSFSVPATSNSHFYILLEGHAGEVTYTMEVNFDPVITYMPIAINVATDDGTPTGLWPYNGSTYLDLAKLNQMITWGNNFWNPYGYGFSWDGTTWTCMSDQFYVLDSGEANMMRAAYHHNPNQLDLYFVSGGVSTAYCVVWSSKAMHNVNNVFSVYGPSVWNWQAVVSHEHGHAFAYFYDQYLYNMNGCACGDNVCLGTIPYLYWNDYGCYGGNLMYYEMLWTWDRYDLNFGQNQWVHQFSFDYVANFPWI